MTITKSSFLFAYSSRYGINPRIGGRPVFSRNSGGSFDTQEGEINQAPVNTPRFSWQTLNLPNSLTERRKVMTLELARTNKILWPRDLTNAVWVRAGAGAATLNAIGLDGTPASATTISDTDAGGSTNYAQSITVPNDSAAHCASFWIAKDATTTRFPLCQLSLVGGTGKAPAVALNTQTGAIVLNNSGQQSYRVVDAGLWWIVEIVVANNSTGNVTLIATIYPAYGSVIAVQANAATGSIVVGQVQVELGSSFMTAPIFTTSAAATRAADSLYYNFPPVPQGMMIYSRHVERGTILATGLGLWGVGNGVSGGQILIYTAGSPPKYTVFHHNGSTFVQAAALVAPAVGDTVETVALYTGAGQVDLIQSINGAAVTDSGGSATLSLPATFGDTRVYANSEGGAVGVGANGLADLRFVKYADVVASTAQGIMDEMRGAEISFNGDLL